MNKYLSTNLDSSGRKMSDFNLSEMNQINGKLLGFDGYFHEDVREFIRLLKEKKKVMIVGGLEEGESIEVITVEDLEELAGEKLK